MTTRAWHRLGRWLGLRPGAQEVPAAPDAELLARTEDFNKSADSYWRSVVAQPAGRRHVLNRPFSGPSAPIDIYRLGLLLAELRPGPGTDVLDFGAGSCWLSACLNRLGCRVVAVDVSPAALELGRELFSLDERHRSDLEPRFLAYDGHRLPLEDGSVDRIACYDAFHHVPNQDEILAEMFRVLRPGGRVVMAEPGEGHSHADASIFDTTAFDVLENDFDILDIERRAVNVGFTQMRLKPYLDPAVEPIPAATYLQVAGLVPHETAPPPAPRIGPDLLAALRTGFRTCAIAVLTKGPQLRDSRCPGVLRATIHRLGPADPIRGLAGTALQLRVRLVNAGDSVWRARPSGAPGSVLLGAHLLTSAGRQLEMEYLRAALEDDVPPGQQVDLTLALPMPRTPGQYLLRLDPVDNEILWFSQAGSPTLDIPIESIDSPLSDAYRARISLVSGDAPSKPRGSRTRLRLRVHNAGRAPWPRTETLGPGSIRLGVRVFRADGSLFADPPGARVELPSAVAPDESCDIAIDIALPSVAGAYTLKVDLVQEGVCWFEERGSTPLLVNCVATDEVADSTAPGVLLAHLSVLQPREPTVRALPGQPIDVRVRAENRGNTVWRCSNERIDGHVRLGALLELAEGQMDFWRAPLPADVSPGGSIEIGGVLSAPTTPGQYAVIFDLVDEGIAWFGSTGSPTSRFTLTVVGPTTSA